MKENIKKLTAQQIKFLRKQFNSLVFNSNFDLVYESQVPNTGIVLLNGEIALYRKKKVKAIVTPGHMLGVCKLLNNEPAQHDYKVSQNSELIMLQKSDILEAIDNQDSELYAIIKETIS